MPIAPSGFCRLVCSKLAFRVYLNTHPVGIDAGAWQVDLGIDLEVARALRLWAVVLAMLADMVPSVAFTLRRQDRHWKRFPLFSRHQFYHRRTPIA